MSTVTHGEVSADQAEDVGGGVPCSCSVFYDAAWHDDVVRALSQPGEVIKWALDLVLTAHNAEPGALSDVAALHDWRDRDVVWFLASQLDLLVTAKARANRGPRFAPAPELAR